jgi:hypothetical protein
VCVRLVAVLEFMLGDRKDEWLAARLEDLDYGYTDGIVAAARKYPMEGVRRDEIDTALGYFEATPPACATTGSASAACSSAPASSSQAARPSSASGSSSPACTGPSQAPTRSSPCAAARPVEPGNTMV